MEGGIQCCGISVRGRVKSKRTPDLATEAARLTEPGVEGKAVAQWDAADWMQEPTLAPIEPAAVAATCSRLGCHSPCCN